MITGRFLSSPSWLRRKEEGGWLSSPVTPPLSDRLDEVGGKPDEGEVKADGELEVQLDGGALVVAADGVLDLNVDLQRRPADDERRRIAVKTPSGGYVGHVTCLWSVEGSVAGVQDPLLPKLVQAVLQLLQKQRV